MGLVFFVCFLVGLGCMGFLFVRFFPDATVTQDMGKKCFGTAMAGKQQYWSSGLELSSRGTGEEPYSCRRGIILASPCPHLETYEQIQVLPITKIPTKSRCSVTDHLFSLLRIFYHFTWNIYTLSLLRRFYYGLGFGFGFSPRSAAAKTEFFQEYYGNFKDILSLEQLLQYFFMKKKKWGNKLPKIQLFNVLDILINECLIASLHEYVSQSAKAQTELLNIFSLDSLV